MFAVSAARIAVGRHDPGRLALAPVRGGLDLPVRRPLRLREARAGLLPEPGPPAGGAALDPRQGHRPRLNCRPMPLACWRVCAAAPLRSSPRCGERIRTAHTDPGASAVARRPSACSAHAGRRARPPSRPRWSWAGSRARSTSRCRPGERTRAVRGRAGAAASASCAAGRWWPRRSSTSRARVGSGGERGLLGLAFHPQYAENGRFFVNYTDRSGDTHISEFRASPPTADAADPATERRAPVRAPALRQPQRRRPRLRPRRHALHRPGRRRLGRRSPGQRPEPGHAAGQDAAHRRGPAARPSRVPADNPFVVARGRLPARSGPTACATPGASRSTAPRATSTSATSARTRCEEVDVRPGAAPRRRELRLERRWRAAAASAPRAAAPQAGLTLPVLEYTHSGGACSITGGVVYRGCRLPGYAGHLLLRATTAAAFIRSFRLQGGQAVDQRDWTAAPGPRRRTASPRSAWTTRARSTSSTRTARSTRSCRRRKSLM